jgi:hypothetical protein
MSHNKRQSRSSWTAYVVCAVLVWCILVFFLSGLMNLEPSLRLFSVASSLLTEELLARQSAV